MAMDDLLPLMRAAFADDAGGLAARVRTIAEAKGYEAGYVRADFGSDRFVEASGIKPAGPRYAIRPLNQQSEQPDPANALMRPGRMTVAIDVGSVDADPGRLEDSLTVYARAVLQVLDALRDFSDATGGYGGTGRGGVVLLEDPVTVTMGIFAGAGPTAPTLYGFTATATIQDRSLP